MDSGKLAGIQALRRAVREVLDPLLVVYVDLCRLEDGELGLAGTPEEGMTLESLSMLEGGLQAYVVPAGSIEVPSVPLRMDPGKATLVPVTELPKRKSGRKQGGYLGRASGRVLEKAAANPGGPRKALGQGLADIRRQREGEMRLRHRMHGLFPARPREKEAETVADWSPVLPQEGRRVDVDGGGVFEVPF